MTVPNVQSQKQSKVKDSVESFIKYMILSKSNLHLAKMIQTRTSSEERNDLADDTNDAVDDIVAGLITADPIFGLAPIRVFWAAIIGQIWTLPALHPKKSKS